LKNVLTINTLDLVYQLNSKNVIAQLAASAVERTRILKTLNVLIDQSKKEDKMRATMGVISIYSKATQLNQVIDEDTSATILKIVKGDLSFNTAPRDLIDEIFKNAKEKDIDKVMNNAILNFELLNFVCESVLTIKSFIAVTFAD
jgi:F0F1-type ATP synthase membrane subunit b/b'